MPLSRRACVPYRAPAGPFDGNPLSEWIKSYKTVEALDFDIVAAGHGALFKKIDVMETREYFEDLVAASPRECPKARAWRIEADNPAGEVQGLGAICAPSREEHRSRVRKPQTLSVTATRSPFDRGATFFDAAEAYGPHEVERILDHPQ